MWVWGGRGGGARGGGGRGGTGAEREEFTRLFTDLVESGYLTLLGSKARVRDGVSVQFLGERALGDAATVRTSLLTRSGDDMPVDYRMRRQGDRWTVRDVVIDGVRSEEHTSELQSRLHLVCRLLLGKKKGEGEE